MITDGVDRVKVIGGVGFRALALSFSQLYYVPMEYKKSWPSGQLFL